LSLDNPQRKNSGHGQTILATEALDNQGRGIMDVRGSLLDEKFPDAGTELDVMLRDDAGQGTPRADAG
jgi:hypothetical protein